MEAFERRRRLQGVALVSGATVAWATGGVFTRLLPFDIFTIVLWRGVFAVVFIGAYALILHGGKVGALIVKSGFAGVMVALCSCATIILFPAAFQSTSIANAFTMLAALPFFTAGLAWIWLKEAPSALTLGFAAIAVLGLFVMVGPYSGGVRFGDALAALGTITQAMMIVAARWRPNVAMLPMIWIAVALSVLLSIPLATHCWDLTTRDYLVAAGFGLGPMTFGMMLYVVGSAMIPAALSALIGLAEAPLGAAWAWICIGEAPMTSTLVGGAIVLASVALQILIERARRFGD